jgi:hypothetical protein
LALPKQNRKMQIALLAGAFLIVVFLFGHFGGTAVFSKPLGRFETTRALVEGKMITVEAANLAGHSKPSKEFFYYNFRPILVPTLAALILLLYSIAAWLRPVWDKTAKILFLPGRYSLDAYILHLSLLALLILKFGKRPLQSSMQGDAALIAVTAACYLWSYGRDFRKSRKTSANLSRPA